MHIAVAGNIGSGKSTLTKMLARHYGWEARFEAVDHNPYLEDYLGILERETDISKIIDTVIAIAKKNTKI